MKRYRKSRAGGIADQREGEGEKSRIGATRVGRRINRGDRINKVLILLQEGMPRTSYKGIVSFSSGSNRVFLTPENLATRW